MNRMVALKYLDNYAIDNVEKALENVFVKFDVENIFKNIKKVLIKVCIPNAFSPDMAETTNPNIVRAVVNLLSKHNIKSVIVESPYKNFNENNLEKVFLASGMLEVANLTTCELSKNLKTSTKPIPNGVMCKSVKLLDIVNDYDAIINIGKVKIDSLGYLGATSNLFGFVPGEVKTMLLNRLNTFKDFYNLNLDIYSAIQNKVVLNILDGIVAKEAFNSPRLLSCLAVGTDCFSVDEAMINILGIDKANTILNQAKARGFFEDDKNLKIIGDGVAEFKIEDFALQEFDETSLIHTNKAQKKKYFKNNQKRVDIKPKSCKGCSICSKICPTNAITMKYDSEGELYAVVDYDKCIFCYKCVTGCPYKVVDEIKPAGYKKLAKQLSKNNNL